MCVQNVSRSSERARCVARFRHQILGIIHRTYKSKTCYIATLLNTESSSGSGSAPAALTAVRGGSQSFSCFILARSTCQRLSSSPRSTLQPKQAQSMKRCRCGWSTKSDFVSLHRGQIRISRSLS